MEEKQERKEKKPFVEPELIKGEDLSEITSGVGTVSSTGATGGIGGPGGPT